MIRGMDGQHIPEPCMDLARGEDGDPVVLPSGERLSCSRTEGHSPRWPHADRDDAGQLVEWAGRPGANPNERPKRGAD